VWVAFSQSFNLIHSERPISRYFMLLY
jgi:hypothetical protein